MFKMKKFDITCSSIEEQVYSDENKKLVEKYRKISGDWIMKNATPEQKFALITYQDWSCSWNRLLREGYKSINERDLLISIGKMYKRLNNPSDVFTKELGEYSYIKPDFNRILRTLKLSGLYKPNIFINKKTASTQKEEDDNDKNNYKNVKLVSSKSREIEIVKSFRLFYLKMTKDIMNLYYQLPPIQDDIWVVKFSKKIDEIEDLRLGKRTSSKKKKIYQRTFNSTTAELDKNNYITFYKLFGNVHETCCMYYIKIPAGSKLLVIPDDFAEYKIQKEIILPIGTTFSFSPCELKTDIASYTNIKTYVTKANYPTNGKIVVSGTKNHSDLMNGTFFFNIKDGSFKII